VQDMQKCLQKDLQEEAPHKKSRR